MPKVAQVIVDIAHSQVDRVFDYALGALCPVPGSRVKVPFGRTQTEGYVVALASETQVPQDKLRPITAILDDAPVIAPALIDLAFWMQRHYHCLLAEALRLMLPPGLRGERIKPKQALFAALAVGEQAALELAQGLARRAPRQAQALLALIERGQVLPAAALEKEIPGAREALRALQKKGAVVLRQLEVGRGAYQDLKMEAAQVQPQLSAGQAGCADAIMRGVEGHSGVYLLHGVTGSGKTEVYFACLSRVLQEGRTAILLVPEISLTPQMVARFRARFGAQAAVLHSRLSLGERFDEWWRIRTGQARVAIGARSAIFAPVEQLGLVIIDEEHESSYRAENAPRYDAVEVAARRAQKEGATLVLGSATPSLERYAAARDGRISLLELPERIGGRALPAVQVADMREELARGNRSLFSRALAVRLKGCMARGEQAILFVNRRGHSSFVSCRSCGYVMECPNCAVSMSYHTHPERMVCHYCGHTASVPQLCPECGSRYIKYFGAGTQQVEKALREMLPQARVLRMDLDTTKTKGAHVEILEAFERGEADILIGTQMVTKGLDYPNVTLVGVLAADITLNIPDYRSPERTFQLITQVAGRAGRADLSGQVVIQTYSPEHYAIALAARQDYKAFFEREMRARKACQYPPFAVFARALCSAGQQDEAMRAAKGLQKFIARYMQQHFPQWEGCCLASHVQMAPLSKIKNEYRAQLLLRIAKNDKMKYALEYLQVAFEQWQAQEKWKGHAFFEINPVNMA